MMRVRFSEARKLRRAEGMPQKGESIQSALKRYVKPAEKQAKPEGNESHKVVIADDASLDELADALSIWVAKHGAACCRAGCQAGGLPAGVCAAQSQASVTSSIWPDLRVWPFFSPSFSSPGQHVLTGAFLRSAPALPCTCMWLLFCMTVVARRSLRPYAHMQPLLSNGKTRVYGASPVHVCGWPISRLKKSFSLCTITIRLSSPFIVVGAPARRVQKTQ